MYWETLRALEMDWRPNDGKSEMRITPESEDSYNAHRTMQIMAMNMVGLFGDEIMFIFFNRELTSKFQSWK